MGSTRPQPLDIYSVSASPTNNKARSKHLYANATSKYLIQNVTGGRLLQKSVELNRIALQLAHNASHGFLTISMGTLVVTEAGHSGCLSNGHL